MSEMKTRVGKLKEMLVMETEVDGMPTIVTYPKGTIVEVSSEDSYPTDYNNGEVEEMVAYMKEYQESPLVLERSVENEAVIGWTGEKGEQYIVVIDQNGDMMFSCKGSDFQNWRDFVDREEIEECFKP